MSDWISVQERLPEVERRLERECRIVVVRVAPLNISTPVLVFDGERVKSMKLEWFDDCLTLPYCVTHWMPLPSPPVATEKSSRP
ncbi:hypothetical protein D9M69_618440 [compost metagenome]